MYIPNSFSEPDREVLFDLIEEYGFATLISWTASEPTVSHLPLLIDRNAPRPVRLIGHMARANRHWTEFDGSQPAMVIFHGPSAYVSPAWYTEHPSVPTWNYAVVHVYGKPRLLDDDATGRLLKRLVDKFEGPRKVRWNGDLPPAFVTGELRAIVGFEIAIDQIQGKFKLSQNKTAADQAGALAGLASEADPRSQELAAFSRKYFARRGGT